MKLIELAVLAVALCVSAFVNDSWADSYIDVYEEETTTVSTTAAPRPRPCSGIPCGYAIFEVSTIVLESFVKNNCECEAGTRCYLNALQGSAYVYRCSEFRNDTDPVINQALVPVQFPPQSGSRILRRISIDD
ncbi:hypothetical protein X975_19693, partial [Stegodyphus mimosarum]